jgi:hypothetical protein
MSKKTVIVLVYHSHEISVMFALFENCHPHWTSCSYIADKSIAKLITLLDENTVFLVFCQHRKIFQAKL